jgi:AraC-like DNA-binding protein
VLGALGDHEDVPGAQLDGAFLAAGPAQRDGEPAVDDQEELIGVLVDVPDVLTLGVRDLNVVIINPADNARAVKVIERGQRLAEADGHGGHAFSIGRLEIPVLYDLDVDAELPGRCHVEAWAPQVPGIREVFHASLVDYAYPPHCHETWAVLIVDEGAIRYDLDRRRCGAAGQAVTILPPGVAHDGRPAPGASGFRKRELYLDPAFLPADLTGAAVDHTAISDPPLRAALSQLHDCLLHNAEDLDAGARLALIAERITGHLTCAPHPAPAPEPGIAGQLRHLLDEHITSQISLAQAAATLDRTVPHLVRRQYGLSPHAYVTGRRIDAARRLLLQGAAPAYAATAVGFYDQAHLTRHFKKHTATTPAEYARSHTRRPRKQT